MKPIQTLTAVIAFGAFAATAGAGEYNVKRTLQLSQSTADVWRMIGGFCDIDDWHPQVISCEEKVIDGKLHRVLMTTGGDRFCRYRRHA